VFLGRRSQVLRNDSNEDTENSRTEESSFLRCNICDKVVSTSSAYTKHMESHSREYPADCFLCSARFPNEELLNIHVNIEHEEDSLLSEPKSARDIENNNIVQRWINSDEGSDSSNDRQRNPSTSCDSEAPGSSKDIILPITCLRCNITFEETNEWKKHAVFDHIFVKDPYPIVAMNYVDVNSLEIHSPESPISQEGDDPISVDGAASSYSSNKYTGQLKLLFCKEKGTYVLKKRGNNIQNNGDANEGLGILPNSSSVFERMDEEPSENSDREVESCETATSDTDGILRNQESVSKSKLGDSIVTTENSDGLRRLRPLGSNLQTTVLSESSANMAADSLPKTPSENGVCHVPSADLVSTAVGAVPSLPSIAAVTPANVAGEKEICENEDKNKSVDTDNAELTSTIIISEPAVDRMAQSESPEKSVSVA